MPSVQMLIQLALLFRGQYPDPTLFRVTYVTDKKKIEFTRFIVVNLAVKEFD